MELEKQLTELTRKETELRDAILQLQRELVTVSDEKTRTMRAMDGVRFTGSAGEEVRFRRYPGQGIAREILSNANLRWYHQCWIK